MGAAVDLIGRSGGDWIHCDVMDGNFVPHITFGHKMVADIRARSALPLDVHLMVADPERLVDDFIDAGATGVTFHVEACVHAHKLVRRIQARGCLAGVSLVPSTPVAALEELAECVDQVLVMSVDPGAGGQAFIERSLDRIAALAALRAARGKKFRIAVDGGVNRGTAAAIRAAGADALIVGSAFFKAADPKAELVALRGD